MQGTLSLSTFYSYLNTTILSFGFLQGQGLEEPLTLTYYEQFLNLTASYGPFSLLTLALSDPAAAFPIFDEFQWKLCKVLVLILLIQLALIVVFWKGVYGERIVEKFMQPSSSSRLIEELKNSISELKLPKEHSPRL